MVEKYHEHRFISVQHPDGSTDPFATVTKNCCPAFQMLLRAHDCASDSCCDPWEFAVEISSIIKTLDRTVIRWLVKRGFFSHARETTRRGDSHRTFVEKESVKFSKRSCFISRKC